MKFDVQQNTMTRRRLLRNAGILTLGVCAAPVLSACGESEGGQGGEGGQTLRIASVRWSSDDIFFNAVQYGQEQEVQRLEEAEGVTIDFTVLAASDESEQVQAMRTQIDLGVDGILHTPWRGEAMLPLLQQAHERGIPVVTHNLIVPEAPQTHVAVDNSEAGRLSAEALVRRLEEIHGPNWAEEGGLIIATRCFTSQAFDIARFGGFEQVIRPILEENPNLTLEVFQTECEAGQARTGIDDLISRYGKDALLGIWSIEGTGAVGGAVPALENRGMLYPPDNPNHIPITSIDGTGPEMEAIERGDLDYAAQQPTIGEGIMSMRTLYHYIQQEQVSQPETALVPGNDSPETWGSVQLPPPEVIYKPADKVWQPIDVVADDRFPGPWYKLPIVGIPTDIPPDSPKSWPNQIEEEGAWKGHEHLGGEDHVHA